MPDPVKRIYDASEKLNAIHATASNAYQTTVPLATMDNIKDVGDAVLTAPPNIMNEFYDAIVNVIGKVLIDTVNFTNPLSDMKKGRMEYGQTIEHIFVEMSRPKAYVAGTRAGESAPDQFEITKARVHAAFYWNQLERQYSVTIRHFDLKAAFASGDPVESLVSATMEALRTGEQYDDYRMTVALLARQLEEANKVAETDWNGRVNLVTGFNAKFRSGQDDVQLTAATALTDKDFLAYMSQQMNMWSERLKYVRSDLNLAGVENTLPKERQHIIMLGDIESYLKTYLYTWAYNKGELSLGSVRSIDAWYSIGADDTTPPTGQSIAPDAITVKADQGDGDACIAVIFDMDMIQIWNKEDITENARNARGHYTNVWHTLADIYAASPFHNFIAFYLE